MCLLIFPVMICFALSSLSTLLLLTLSFELYHELLILKLDILNLSETFTSAHPRSSVEGVEGSEHPDIHRMCGHISCVLYYHFHLHYSLDVRRNLKRLKVVWVIMTIVMMLIGNDIFRIFNKTFNTNVIN